MRLVLHYGPLRDERMKVETMEERSSKQVTKAFLFERANDFVKTRPELSSLSRSARRAYARQMANRIGAGAREEMRRS